MALASFTSPLGGRKQVNAEACRCIWADIDAGKPGGKYANAREALHGLNKFISETGLEPNLLVSSGMGLHAYWTFTKNIPAAQWVQLAQLFHQLCIQQAFEVDPTRATDIASVLRLPGTIHQKTGRTVSVLVDNGMEYVPKEFLAQIGRMLHSTPPVQKPLPVLSPVNQHPLASLMGMGPEPPKANAEKIAQNCPQMLTMGFGLYPQWFAAMSVLRRCVEGAQWAHQLSAMDSSRYDPSDCERRFHNAAEDGPARCVTFEVTNPELCLTCPHRGKITSPIQLSSMEFSTPPPVIDPQSDAGALLGHTQRLTIPESWIHNYVPFVSQKYIIDPRGIVWLKPEKGADGNIVTTPTTICSTQLWFKYTAHCYEDGKHKTIHYFDAIFPGGKIRELQCVAGEDDTEYNIIKWLNRADIRLSHPGFGKEFMAFMNAYLDSILQTKKTIPIVKEFGWTKVQDPVLKQETDAFVVGKGAITETGIHPIGHDPSKSGKFANREFKHTGTLEGWKPIAQMYTTLKNPMGEFGICASLASGLMKFGIAEATNAYINVFSTMGGKGKSTLAKAMHSVWGDPFHAFGSPQASISQRGRALSVWSNLPFFVDEVTDMKDADMRTMVYILAGGKDKNRLKSNADFMDTGDWSTCTMSTANKSVKEALSRVTGDGDATLLRLIEYEWNYPSYDDEPVIQEYIRACLEARDNNYGVAGPEFMYQVMNNSSRLLTLRQFVDNWRLDHHLKNNERYMAFPIGIALVAGRWAKEWGIVDFDMDALEQWVLDELIPFNRRTTAELSPDFVDHMNVYIAERAFHTLIVKRDHRDKAREPDPKCFAPHDKFIIRMPMQGMALRFEQENYALKMAAADFKRWCSEHSLSPRVVLNQLAQKGIAVEQDKANLGSDTWLASSTQKVFVIRGENLRRLGYTAPTLTQPPTEMELATGMQEQVGILQNMLSI